MKTYNIWNDTIDESELQRVFKLPIHPRDSKNFSDKWFVNFSNGQLGGTHWIDFYVKNNKSFYFDNFGGAPDELLTNQLSQPIRWQNYEIQDINSRYVDHVAYISSI